MTTRREPADRDDAQVRIVALRLQGAGDASRPNSSPAARSLSPPAARSAQARRGNNVAQLRQIVLVDRDVDALRDIAIALRDQFDFHVTISGNEALNLLQSGAIDAIVVGQTLYSSTGLSVLAEARRRAPHTQRVLLANATEATDLERNSAPALPFRILERPCTPQKLVELLDAADDRQSSPESSALPAHVTPLHAVTPVYHGDYEHVVLETPRELPRRRSRRQPGNGEFAAENLPVVVYTDDGEFYQSICTALQDHYDVRLVTQLDRLVEMSETGVCPILITDRAGTQAELQRISIAVRAAEPALVTIASGTPSEGLALRKLLNTPALHSFLPKPVSASLLRLTLESATRHYIDAKTPQSELPEQSLSETSIARSATTPRREYRPLQTFNDTVESEERFDFRRLLPYAWIAASLLIAIAAGGWYWQHQSQGEAQLSVLIDAELDLAKRAYDAGDYTTPENANALYFYRRVLKRDPAQAQALQGIERIAERIVEQAERQITDDMLDAAEQSIALLRELRPDHKRLAFLEGQTRKGNTYRQAQRLAQQSAEMARTEAAKANAATARLIESQTAETPPPLISNASQRLQAVARWLATARQRMTQGRLITPETDSAEYYLRLAERADPNNLSVDQGLREIGTRLLSEAEEAVSQQQLDRARKRLNDASRFGPDANTVTRIQGKIEAAASNNVRGNYLRLALQRTRENALFEPAQDSAKYYLSQLQRLDESAREVQQVTHAIAIKLIDNANQATAQQQFNAAIRLLDEARRLGFSGAELNDAQRRLDVARSPPKPVPPAVSTPVVAPKILKSVAAKFPEDARNAGVSGWVDVGFKIDSAGNVYDAAAISSTPPGPYATRFERAAVNAISQYKFEPRAITDNQMQSMVVRVQFKLQ